MVDSYIAHFRSERTINALYIISTGTFFCRVFTAGGFTTGCLFQVLVQIQCIMMERAEWILFGIIVRVHVPVLLVLVIVALAIMNIIFTEECV